MDRVGGEEDYREGEKEGKMDESNSKPLMFFKHLNLL